ncbi:hypothetical protein DXG01_008785 [Tephrocybe rancida]|nr:hypothetical protein DXG01_008785 [Tephrocybe rancida]
MATSLAPWEKWELDVHFFTALSQWTKENPQTSLDRVLINVDQAIQHGREFFEAIPDGVFPARGLVKALAQLIKLGKVSQLLSTSHKRTTIATANSDIQAFAKAVVHWVNETKATFEATQTGWWDNHFTKATWKNLAGIRDLIDEICKWAASRLMDRRWSVSGIKNRLTVNEEITDFKARIVEARAVFNERSLINQARGIDAILRKIQMMLDRQNDTEAGQRQIQSTLDKIYSTQSDHLKHIIERMDDDAEKEKRRQYVLQMLSTHAVQNTSYVEQGKPPCDKDTRVDVLKEIVAWVEDVTQRSQNFLWLTGDPGCGKSAVTASIARTCKDKGCLWAQFFINRNNVDTTNPNAYFPSIARQFAQYSPVVELEIHDRLKAKPSLVDVMSPEQATGLFIDAIRVASRLDPRMPVVIVIDGLDETDRKHLKSTADIISHLFNALIEYPNAKVFISSRTEDDIRNPFARTINSTHVKHLHLDVNSDSSIKDVSAYFRRKIARIVLDNELDWQIWPGDERMDLLAKRAAGLFIWAVTAAKFFQEQVDYWGTECLDDLLDNLNSDGMGDINTLYSLILSVTYKEQADDWAFESFRRLIGTIVTLHEPLCLDDIKQLLHLRKSKPAQPVDVVKFVKRLRTVLVAGTGVINGQTVPRLHKSFFEFITSHDRVDSRFRVDMKSSHLELGFACLRQLPRVRNAAFADRMPAVFRYAFRFLSSHMHQGLGTTSGIALPIESQREVDIQKFENLLRCSSSKENAAPVFVSFSQNRASIRVSIGGQERTWAVNDGLDQNRLEFRTKKILKVKDEFPPTLGTLPPDGRHVIFSPRSPSSICFWDTDSENIIRRPLDDGDKLGSGEMWPSVCAFSQDGLRFAIGVTMTTVCVWDAQNLKAIGPPLTGANGTLSCIALSPAGQWLAAGYTNGSVAFWNLRDGTSGQPIKRQSRRIATITFSPDSTQALSCSDDGHITLWAPQTSEHIRDIGSTDYKKGHGGTSVHAVAFSPDGLLALTGGADNTIRLWDINTGEHIHRLSKHTNVVLSVQFSPDGKEFVSGSMDGTACVWNLQTRQIIGSPLVHQGWVRAASFSPDGYHICTAVGARGGVGCTDLTLWGPATIDLRQSDFAVSVLTAFSRDGAQVASVAPDKGIQLWDTWQKQEVITLKRFKGNEDFINLRHFAFSSDGLQVAASTSSGIILLWELKTGQLWTSPPENAQPDIADLYFTHDHKVAAETHKKTTTVWKTMSTSRSLALVTVRDDPRADLSIFLDLNTDAGDDVTHHGMHWIPFKTSTSGLWALVNDHIVRVNPDGTTAIASIDLERASNFLGWERNN